MPSYSIRGAGMREKSKYTYEVLLLLATYYLARFDDTRSATPSAYVLYCTVARKRAGWPALHDVRYNIVRKATNSPSHSLGNEHTTNSRYQAHHCSTRPSQRCVPLDGDLLFHHRNAFFLYPPQAGWNSPWPFFLLPK